MMKNDPKKNPLQHCLKLKDWPLQDRHAWLKAGEIGDFFADGGIITDWASGTARKVEIAYGRWLTWLALTDRLSPDVAPAARASPDNVAAYIEHLQSLNAPYTVLGRVRDLGHALKAIAPHQDWSWLHRIARRLRKTVTSTKTKRPLMIPSADLFSHGIALMDSAETSTDRTPLDKASDYRKGLMLALLAARPLRRRNFTTLAIGQSFVRQSGGYWIIVPGPETKTGHPIEVPVPEALTRYIDRYLSHHRPLLISRSGGWIRGNRDTRTALWISDHCSAMSEGSVYYWMNIITIKEFGHALSPHLFRDCAATSIAIEDPEHVYITTSILGHTCLATSEQHYNHAQSHESHARVQDAILELRKSGRDRTVVPHGEALT